MRIESITKENLEKENDNELFSLRMRFSQLYKKFYETNLFRKSDFNFLERKDFLDKYRLLVDEIKRRKLKVAKSNKLDRVIFGKDMVGVDVRSLPDIPVTNDYISITGSFLKSPKSIGEFSIYIRDTADKRLIDVEERVKQTLEEELNRSPAVMKHEEPEDDYLPIYELVLKPKEGMRIVKAIERIEKGAIAYKDYGHADEGTSWDAGKEVKQMEVEQLKKYCAWYKSDKPDLKSSYKLPHHRVSDGKAVWRAVYAAMAALLGARGGVQLPSGDRKGVYNHLKSHYKAWDKEPPELKKYEKSELQELFKDDEVDISKPYPNEHSARLQDPKKYDDWRRTKGGKIYFKIAIPASIAIIWGHPKGKPARIWVPQALRFPKDKYTVAQAKKFLSDNKIASIKFEPAVEKAKKETEEKQKYNCECIECGHKLTSDKHCKDVKCPKCGGTMRRVERPGPGEKSFKFDKIDKKQQIVGGIIYEPDTEDTQGDYMEADEIEKMAYKYMTGDKKFKINHKGKEYIFPIIESFIPEQNTTKNKQIISKGAWWIMIKITNKDIWKQIEKGELSGFSMGGTASSKDI